MDVWDVVTSGLAPFSEGMEFLPKDRGELRRMIRWMMLIARDLSVMGAAHSVDFARCRRILVREESIVSVWDAERAERAVRVLRTAESACRLSISVKSIWDMVLLSLLRIRKEI